MNCWAIAYQGGEKELQLVVLAAKSGVFRGEGKASPADGRHSRWGWVPRSASGRGPGRMETGEGGKGEGVGREGEDPVPGMTLDPSGQGNDLLNDGFHPSPLGRVAWRGIRPQQRFLTDHAQDVVGQGTQGEEKIVGGKFPRRQALQVQIGLDLRMELLMSGMIRVQRNDGLRVEMLGQRCVPALQGVFRHQQLLAVGEGRPFRQAQDPAYRDRAQGFRTFPKRDSLARPQALPMGFRVPKAIRNEPVQIVATPIPLDKESQVRPLLSVCVGIAGQGGGDALAVKTGVHAYQDRLPGEAQGSGQDAIQGLIGRFGAVLRPFPQFHADVPALLPQVSGNGGVTDETGVSPANPLLLGVGVVKGEDVQIQRHIATSQWGNRHPGSPQQPGQRCIGYRQEVLGMAIQALPQGGAGGNPAQSQGAGIEWVLAEAFDGLKVAFALTQQTQHGHEDIAVGNARAYGQGRIHQLRQLRETMQGLPHQGQTSQGSQWAAALFEDKFRGFHVHPLGETSQSVLYHGKHSVASNFR